MVIAQPAFLRTPAHDGMPTADELILYKAYFRMQRLHGYFDARLKMSTEHSSHRVGVTRNEVVEMLTNETLTTKEIAQRLGRERNSMGCQLRRLKVQGVITDAGKRGKDTVWKLSTTG